jgi:TrmH family RNA methyltransferase
MRNETTAGHQPLEFAHILPKVRKLQSDRRFRDNQRLFFAEGIRNFVEAVDHHFPVETIIYSEKLLISPVARKMVRRLKRDGTPFARVSPEEFRKISITERASGIAAIFRQPILKLVEVTPEDSICWTAISDIRSLGNFGTLIRTSAAVGAGGFILIGERVDPFDPSVVRATMGALFKQKIIKTTYKELQLWIRNHNLQVVGASPNGSLDYNKADYKPGTILVLGNERSGLTENEQALCQQLVRIPMVSGMDSLNVAVAGSLLLYEVFMASR